MKKKILIILLIVESWVTGCGGGSSHPLSLNDSQVDHADLLSRFKNFPIEEKNPSFTLENGQTIIGFRKGNEDIKDILTLPISYSSEEVIQKIKIQSNWLGENLIEIKILNNETRSNIKFKFLAIETGGRPISPKLGIDSPKIIAISGVEKKAVGENGKFNHGCIPAGNQNIDLASLRAIFSLTSKINKLTDPLIPEIIKDSDGNYWLEYSLSEADVYSPSFNLSYLSSNKVDAGHAVKTDFSLSERQSVAHDSIPLDEDDRLIAFTVARASYSEILEAWFQSRFSHVETTSDYDSDSGNES